MFNESTVYNDTARIIEAIKEQINSEVYDSMVIDHAEYLINESHDIFNQKGLVEWLIDEDLTDEDYRSELESWTQDSLEYLADELRNSDEAAHDWADGDQRVIYTGQAIEYYQEHTNEVEEKSEEYGATGDISERITLGVYGCIYSDYVEELNDLAADIESYDAEDFI